MKKWLITILIIVLILQLQWGAPPQEETKKEEIKVAVLPFSVNVFDKKKLTNEIFKVKNVLQIALKARFGESRVFETGKAISYYAVDGPTVTINPVIKNKTIDQLKKICEENSCYVVVFGHFEEVDQLIVKIRYYVSKTQTIHSEFFEINADTMKISQLRSDAAKLIQKIVPDMAVAISGKKVPIPKVSAKAKPKPGPVKKTPRNTPTPRPKDKKPVKKTVTTKKKANIKGTKKKGQKIKFTPPEKLTPAQIYRMILDNGFYCEIVKSPIHYEGLKGINIPKNGTFKFRRKLFSGRDGKMLNTLSMVGEKKLPVQKRIELKWSPKVEKLSFAKTVKKIEKLNKKDSKKRTWRIPTAMELFSIISEVNNHFPAEFKFPKNKTMYFWTSTALKKEGTGLAYEKEKKAQIIIRNKYDPKTKNYSLTFAHQHINGKEKAYLIPVHTKGNDMYTFIPMNQTQNGKLEGFEMKKEEPRPAGMGTNIIPPLAKKVKPVKAHPPVASTQSDKIPGFDDGPTTPRKVSAKIPPKTRNEPISSKTPGFDDPVKKPKRTYRPRTKNSHIFRIALYPYMWIGEERSRKLTFLDEINKMIKVSLESLFISLERGQYPGLKTSIFKTNDTGAITKFYNIMAFPKKKFNQKKARDVIEDIMAPNGIDVLIAIKSDKVDAGINRYKIYLIDRLNLEFHPVITNFSDKVSLDHGAITKPIKQKIENIFHDYFNGERKGLHIQLKID